MSGTGDKNNRPPAGSTATNANSKRPAGTAPSEALSWGPLKKQGRTDPLVSHGRHFGRTIRTFCRLQTPIMNSLAQTMQLELGRIMEDDLSTSELSEHRLYTALLAMSPGLEERLNTGTEEDLIYVATMLTKGINSARSDDTKSMKSAIVDWITPHKQVLTPPIQRNVKTDQGFHHERTGELLCPVNFDWSDSKIRRELESGSLQFKYNPDDPWEGLLRSSLLVKAYKHVFTSPSSVASGASKATRSSNARLHGMESVTIPSIAYIATQVRFALSSQAVFSRTDLVTDSEYFYNLIIDVLEDPEEHVETTELVKWWNQQIFPTYLNEGRVVSGNSVATKIKERRRLINAGLWDKSRESSASPAEP
ncbi:hypothetical protein FA13DRAFT_1753579 [Coprinellus micaceus]|uniref:Uncharacterized protein n=1 Tax=Coprinellus micaceus TaxID=71717 RepID=A0A4Y7TLZ1_COPMI|nr:hypothetical protein FA13DRAFT_1753579 [Coprinellus micaceus]